MLTRIILYILIFFIFIFAYLKYFEKNRIYYPLEDLSFTPEDIGLKYEDIYFETEDNLMLNGWFIPVDNARGTLIFCHGNAGNISHRLEIILIFNKLSLNVFIFDYRGYGRSQGKPSEQGLYKDTEASYQYIISRSDIDKERIVIYGKSIGANVAIDLASKVKTSLLISEGSFTSAYDMGRKLFPYLPIKWMISIKFDAIGKIKNIKTPKLIIHSKDDEIIPFSMGERLFEAAAEPKEFYQMQGTHNEAIFIYRDEYTSRIDNFLNKYLTRS